MLGRHSHYDFPVLQFGKLSLARWERAREIEFQAFDPGSPAAGWVSYEATILQAPSNSIVLLPPNAGFNIGWLKIRSGTKSLPVKQSADRQFAIMFG